MVADDLAKKVLIGLLALAALVWFGMDLAQFLTSGGVSYYREEPVRVLVPVGVIALGLVGWGIYRAAGAGERGKRGAWLALNAAISALVVWGAYGCYGMWRAASALKRAIEQGREGIRIDVTGLQRSALLRAFPVLVLATAVAVSWFMLLKRSASPSSEEPAREGGGKAGVESA